MTTPDSAGTSGSLVPPVEGRARLHAGLLRRAPLLGAHLAGLALVLMSVGCGPPWRVIKQSGPPSALADIQSLGVKFDYSRISLGGKSEQQFLASKSEEERAKFQEVKSTMDNAFLIGLRSRLPDLLVRQDTGQEDATLTVRYTMLEQGKYAVVFAMDTELAAHLAFARNGAVTDEIAVDTAVDATVTQPAILQRVKIAAERLADLGAQYVRQARSP